MSRAKTQKQRTPRLLRFGQPLPGTRNELVTLHPLADEAELHSRLGIRPEECVSCDAWWMYDGVLSFVSIDVCHRHGSDCSPGIIFHLKRDPAGGRLFVVRIQATFLTTTLVRRVYSTLAAWAKAHPNLLMQKVFGPNRYRYVISRGSGAPIGAE